MPNENPFQDPLRFERQVPECVIVIFGANGDLTKRKLLPALYRLAFDRRLSAGFAIVGISRTPLSDDAFREKMRESVEQFSEDTKIDNDVWAGFARGLFYVAGDIGDQGLYQRLGKNWGRLKTSGTPAAMRSSIFRRSPASTPRSRTASAPRDWEKETAGGGSWWRSPSGTTWRARAS
jgi:glucose-6-phosphate 1-dehydrogenase